MNKFQNRVIEAFVEKQFNIQLDDLIKMMNSTKAAFKEGVRK